MASIILAHENGDPIDYIVFSEVMFDKQAGISGENPEHIRFIREVAVPRFEEWGYKVLILRAERDYLDFFNRRIEKPRKNEVHRGLKFGFPCQGLCGVKRDCKEKPIKGFIRSLEGPVTQYVGIAVDEPNRLESMKKDPMKVSLLEKYGYTEEMAKKKCMEYGLLSPTYGLSKRGGCFFCPYAKLEEHRMIKEQYPEVWARFVALEDEKDIAYKRWNVHKETLRERDELLDKMSEYEQVSIFDFISV